jgi:hypothetical protein
MLLSILGDVAACHAAPSPNIYNDVILLCVLT